MHSTIELVEQNNYYFHMFEWILHFLKFKLNKKITPHVVLRKNILVF